MARKFSESNMADLTAIVQNQSLCVCLLRKDVLKSSDEEPIVKGVSTVICVSPMDETQILKGPCFEFPFYEAHEFTNALDNRPIHHWVMTFCAFLTALDCEVFIRTDADTIVAFNHLDLPEDIKIFNPQEIVNMILKNIYPGLIKEENETDF